MPADRRAELRRMIVRRLNTDEWMERHFAISCHAGDVADAVMEVLDESWPMPAEPGYTPDPADVELVASALARRFCRDGRDGLAYLDAVAPGGAEPEREDAGAVLSALAAAGRLAAVDALPHAGETEQTARSVLDEIAAERQRQDAKWGEQNHPDNNPADIYTGPAEFAVQADRWKLINAERAARGATAWDGVLLEEVYEALAESDPAKLRAELVQVAAVAVAQIEAIDRR